MISYRGLRGFTLIELLISLILGLLISAAALQVFYTSTVSSNLQQAGTSVVDNNTFGFDYLTKQIRKANFGALASGEHSSFYLNPRTPLGGIVLSTPKDLTTFGDIVETQDPTDSTKKVTDLVASNLRGLSNNNSLISDTLLTKSQSSLSMSNVTTASGTPLKSDQLTIQYQVTMENQMDCQGRNVKKNDYVIERYFVRSGGLACASAIYTYDESSAKKDTTNQNAIDISKYTKPDGTNGTSDLAGNGEIIIPNVDYFGVLLGVSNSSDFAIKPSSYNLKYVTIPTRDATPKADQYPNFVNNRIVSVQIALLIRSDGSVTASPNPQFDILDKVGVNGIKLATDFQQDGKMRKVLQTTVLLRNARGAV